jgi:hypothetical protein
LCYLKRQNKSNDISDAFNKSEAPQRL